MRHPASAITRLPQSSALALITALASTGAEAATQPVVILNPVTHPVMSRSVDEPALGAVQIELSPSSATSNYAQASYVVPAGKRLVIEYYSAQRR